MERDYNTTRNNLTIREYGRNVQNLVTYALTIEDKEKRTKLAQIIISVMKQVSPGQNINEEYYKKLWNHLYAISNYKLDVDYPYPVHKLDTTTQLPSHIDYNQNKIRYKFYGINTQLLLNDLSQKEESKERTALLVRVANQMKEMYISWNKNIVEDSLIDEHIQKMTNGKLKLPEGIELLSSNNVIKKLQLDLQTLKSLNLKNAKSKKPGQKDKRFVHKKHTQKTM